MAHSLPVIANDRSSIWVPPFFFLGFLLFWLWLAWMIQQAEPLIFVVLCAGMSGLYFVQAARWERMHAARQRAVSFGMQAGVPLAIPPTCSE